MSRRAARRHTLMATFALPFHAGLTTEAFARHLADYLHGLSDEDERPTGEHAAYFERVAWGVFDKQTELDGVVSNFLKSWTIDRIAKIDLAIMRLAIHEILREPDVPPAVAVNEAVNLAKEFGTDESGAFTNGILAAVARELSHA
jgi:N utilization substance protein B